jgi:hypothetical protein
MATKKKASKKKAVKKVEAPKLCLRQIDSNTVQMSDDPKFPEATDATKSQEVPKGMVRIDAYNVIKA